MEKQVESAGGKIHIYSYGGGPVTVVFLSGSGVLFPQIEYWDFQKALAGACQIIGIEKFGYGHSDLAVNERTIDTVVDEYRSALRSFGIVKPVVLAAHSMGFLEALRWGQRYPAEVIGMIGVDPATPECYRDFDLQKAVNGLKELSVNEILRKTTAVSYVDRLVEEHFLLPDEKEDYTALAYRNLANPNWISEAVQVKDSLEQIERNTPYLQVPTLFLVSNGEGTTISKEAWHSHAKQYLLKIRQSRYEEFDYPHNLYKYVYKEMTQIAAAFLSEFFC